MVSNPHLLPFAIASTTGELADANQIIISVTAYDGTGNLNNTHVNVQLLADAVNGLTILDAENVRDTVAAFIQQGTNITVTHDDVGDTLTIASTAGLSAEEVRDTIAAFLVAGANIDITHNDAANTLTIDATGGAGGGLDAEQVRDTVATFIQAGTGVSVTHDDPLNSLTISLTLPNTGVLSEFSEVDTRSFTEKIDTEAVVRFWLRQNLVTSGTANDVGTGVRIDESNGDLSSEGDTYQDDQNHTNEYLYMSISTTYASSADLSTHYIVIKDLDGTIRQTLQMSTNFVDVTSDLGLSGSGNTFYRMNSGGIGGVFPQYRNNQTIELFIETINQFFDIPEANADNVDFTRAVKDLPESALDADTQAKLNAAETVPYDDQFKLDQMVEVTTSTAISSADDSSVLYWTFHEFSNDVADYNTSDFVTGMPPNLAPTARNYVAVVPHQYTVTSFSGPGGETGTVTLIHANINLIGVTGVWNAYRVSVAPTSTATNFLGPVGTVQAISQIDLNEIIKVDRENLTQELQDEIDNTNPSSNVDAARLTSLETKVAALYPLTPNVDDLDDWAAIYEPLRPVTEVRLTDGYSLIADYRGDATRYESAGVTYDATGVNVVRYTGLGENLYRTFGFKVDGPADQVLMWLVDGAEVIPYVDMTLAGNFRINNYTIAHTGATPVSNRVTFVPRTTGNQLVDAGSSSNSGFTIPDVPTGATDVTRTAEFNVDIYVNSVNTNAGGIISFPIPVPDAVQDRQQISHTFNLGPLHGNRSVAVTFEYRFVITGTPEFRVIMTVDAAPSDVAVDFGQLELVESYTPADTVSRTDNFVTFQDAGGDFTFVGGHELLLTFQPIGTTATTDAVGAVINASSGAVTELNDRRTPIPANQYASVEIPDQTALAGFEFRTFSPTHFLRHSDLGHLLADRAVQWCYGLARSVVISMINAVTEPLDLAVGSTLGGAAIQAGQIESVYESTGTGTGPGELVASVVLPVDYTDFDYCHVTEYDVTNLQWRHAAFKISILALATTNDNIRLQGNTVLQWTLGTRTLAMNPSAQEIFSVELVKV